MTHEKGGYTIKKVSERTGISVQTLRAWERRYGVPKPSRVPGNRYRVYDEQDIADVLWMKQRIGAGVLPAQASALFHEQAARLSLSPLDILEQPVAVHQDALLAAFEKSDEPLAQHLLDEAFAMYAPEQVALWIIQPTLVEIGRQWLQGRMAVWQEHLATNLIRRKLTAIRQAQPALPSSAPHLVAACAPDEEHEIGMLILAMLATRHGWRVSYLGQRTPLSELVDYVRQGKPTLAAISCGTVIGLSGLIPLLEEANRPPAPLAFGGRLLDDVPGLRDRLPGAFLTGEVLANMRLLSTVAPRTAFWSPHKRSYAAAQTIEEYRFKIAGDTAVQLTLLARHPQARGMSYGMLNLADTLACALAFDLPELMEHQGIWFKEFMTSRAIKGEWVSRSLEAFARATEKSLTADAVKLVRPLLERLHTSVRPQGTRAG
ncbi:MAG: MerR family transcriptional regulator [Acidobacteriota bacterium]